MQAVNNWLRGALHRATKGQLLESDQVGRARLNHSVKVMCRHLLPNAQDVLTQYGFSRPVTPPTTRRLQKQEPPLTPADRGNRLCSHKRPSSRSTRRKIRP